MLSVALDRSGVIDDDFTVAAVFGWDDEEGRACHLVISALKQLEPQDIELGHTGLHVELNDQAHGAYRAVDSVCLLSGRDVEIVLSREGRLAVGNDLIVLSGTERDCEAIAMLARLAQAAGVGA